MTAFRRVLPGLLFVGLVLLPSVAQPQDGPSWTEQQRSTYHGRWRLSTSRAQAEQRVQQAVEEVVAQMAFFTRPIARDRLRSGSPVDNLIELSFADDSELTVRFGARASYTSRLGRTTRTRRADGSAITLTQRFDAAGNLEQVFQSDTGTRWYAYRSTGDDQLRLTITTNSERLPQPLRVSLDYRRE